MFQTFVLGRGSWMAGQFDAWKVFCVNGDAVLFNSPSCSAPESRTPQFDQLGGQVQAALQLVESMTSMINPVFVQNVPTGDFLFGE
jgi:hypothetical protein